MATIVPLSHSVRWRSRSRTTSADLLDEQATVRASRTPQSSDELVHNFGHSLAHSLAHSLGDSDSAMSEWDEEPSDEEDAAFDELQTSAWLVVPREFANPTRRSSRRRRLSAQVRPHARAAVKSMERRRADESSR